MVTGAVAGEVGSLLELARSVGVAGAEIAGLDGEDDRRELAGWSAEDVPDLTIRPPEWTVQVEQPRRSWRRADPGDGEGRDRLGAALAAAVGVFTDRARAAFADAAREWARRLDEQAARQMRQAADWFRQCLRTVPSDEDLAAADSLIARLAAFQASLEGAGPPPTEAVIGPPGGGPDAAAEGCMICKQMEKALTSHLFTGQFRLATREDEQERHTLVRGFCPLHTWQYAAVASLSASPPGTRNWPPRSRMRWSHSAVKALLPRTWPAALPPSPPSRGGARCARCWPTASAPR